HLLISLKASRRLRGEGEGGRYDPPREWPRVSIHLPFHNEGRVAARILEACIGLDYPRDRLEIIVVDDSDDGTTDIARRFEALHPSLVRVIHRLDRKGFKAGALNLALAESRGDFIAVFDADYVPPPSFLKEALPPLLARGDLAFVQARCGHLNADYNWVTKAAATAHEWFWNREQKARYATGFFTHFGGTGAVFRRRALTESGGWPEDTLTEDLDLSVRLQLDGWRYLYMPEITCPGEIPIRLRDLLRQQFRWAKGFTQCLIKHTPNILRSGRLSWTQKMEALMQLSSYFTAPALIGLVASSAVSIAASPLNVLRLTGLSLLGEALIPVAAGLATLKSKGEKEEGGREGPRRSGKSEELHHLLYLAALTPLFSIVYTKAVIEALLGVASPFHRTPKYGLVTEPQPHKRVYARA
ncbi:MAG: glycosyltransferase, partial [Candidatus Bathyarchaeia archaeon]